MHILFLLNKVEGTWIRSPEELNIQQKLSESVLLLINAYLQRSEGIQGTIYFIDHGNYIQQRFLELQKAGTIIINLCSGTDLDGLVGPSLSILLEKKHVPFVGPSSSFLLNTIDKKRLKETLIGAQINTKVFEICKSTDTPKMAYPYVLGPADSYVGNRKLVQTAADLDEITRSLGVSFPLLMAEEYTPSAIFKVFIMDNDYYCTMEISEDIVKIAKSAYFCLKGEGPAIVEVGCDMQTLELFILDVHGIGVLGHIHRTFGLDKALQVFNKMLQKKS